MADKPAGNQNEQVFRREGRNWLILLALIVAALVISTGIAMAGRWVYREYIEDEPQPTSPLEIESEGQTGPAGQTEQSGQGQRASGGSEGQTEGSGQGSGTSGDSESDSESNQNQNGSSEPLPGTGG